MQSRKFKITIIQLFEENGPLSSKDVERNQWKSLHLFVNNLIQFVTKAENEIKFDCYDDEHGGIEVTENIVSFPSNSKLRKQVIV